MTLGSVAQCPYELLTRFERLRRPRCSISIRFTLSGLPLSRPEPRLGGINQFLGTQQDAVRRELGVQQIAVLQASSPSNLVRQGQLPFCPQRSPCHEAILHSDSRTFRLSPVPLAARSQGTDQVCPSAGDPGYRRAALSDEVMGHGHREFLTAVGTEVT